jgi:predicted aspartyl protease
MIFKYLSVEGFGKAPFIPLFLRDIDGKEYVVRALIDSGAEGMLLPKVIAELLGLKETGRSFTKGISGGADVSKTSVAVKISNDEESYDLKLDARVLQNEDSTIPVLLGRTGFFDAFHITFKQNEETIILERAENGS